MSGFLLLKKHVEGSAADVFLASDETTHSRVLLQVMRPNLVKDDVAYGRFIEQARRRGALSHPGLVRLAETRCRADGAVMAVSEPVDGVDLGEWMKQHGTLTPPQVLALVGPICDALDYLHRRGVVHGNVCPAYIFVEGTPDQPRVRLLEAGLALLRVGDASKPPIPSVLVSTDHLAPERILGSRATHSSDLYSLGILIYELVTGSPPFRRRDLDSTRRAHLDAPVPELPAVARDLWPVVARCLEKEAVRRFSDALRVKEALADALNPVTAPMGPLPVVQGLPLGEPEPEPILLDRPKQRRDDTPTPILSPAQSEPMLGQWIIEKPLGEGGMGRVWLGRHASMGRRVAVKVLKRHWLEDPMQVARFLREAQVVAKVRHPHVVEVLDCGQESAEQGGDVYIVLELLSGKSLSQLGRGRGVGVARAVRLVRQAALGLEAAHLLGVVHRDVKPDNLFVCAPETPEETLKVVDFGVARLTETILKTIERTREGLVVGTPAYMAPEQSCGDPATPQADIYALATVLYALISGRLPFDGRTPEELMLKRFREKPKRLDRYSHSGEEVPPGLWPVISRGLEREPDRRILTMAEFYDCLEPFEEPTQRKGLFARARAALKA